MMRERILAELGPIESRPLRLVELPVPEPGPGQVRLRVAVCGACHTELDQVEGRLTSARPIVSGHRIVGRVDMIGSAVTDLAVGDRVGVAWIFSACGACRFCRAGLANLCRQAQWTGKDANGGASWQHSPQRAERFLPVKGRRSCVLAPCGVRLPSVWR